MNKVILSGRWTKDPEVKYTGEGTAIAKGTLAVDRRVKRDSDVTADFIRVVAFGKIAEVIEKYFFKGMKAVIVGRIQTGSYDDKDGKKVYTTDVIIEEIEFAEVKSSHTPNETVQEGKIDDTGFVEAPVGTEEVFNF